MNRGISGTSRSSVLHQFLHKKASDILCIFHGRESFLGGKRIFVQPIQKLLAIHSLYLRLGEMDMGINKAGCNQFTGIVCHREIRVTGTHRLERPRLYNLSINNSQSPILKIAVSLHMIQRGSDQIEHFSPI